MPTLNTSDFKTLDGRVEVELCLETRTLLFICAECRALLLESSMDVVEDVGDVPRVIVLLAESVREALEAHTCLTLEAGGLLAVERDQLAGSGPRSAGLVFGGVEPASIAESAVALSQASRGSTRQAVEAFQALGRVVAPATEAIRNFGRVAGRATVHPHHTRTCKEARCPKCGEVFSGNEMCIRGGMLYCADCTLEVDRVVYARKAIRVIRF